MPDLPVLTLTQTQFDRVVAAFPGDTLAKKAEAYTAWSIGHLIDFVQGAEIRQFELDQRAQMENRIEAIKASLPPRPVYPPVI